MPDTVDATKVEQDGPILLGANKLLHTGSNPVLTAKQIKIMFYNATNKKDFLIGWILGAIFVGSMWVAFS